MNEASINLKKGSSQESYAKQALQLKLLSELSTKLQGLMNSEDDFYKEVVRLIQKKFHYYSIQMWKSQADGSAVLKAHTGGYHPHMTEGYTIQKAKQTGITGYVLQTGQSYLCHDVTKDPHFSNLSFPVQSKSELCVPLLQNGRAIGSLNIESDEVGAFDENDVITLESVASQVAVAITNRGLFSEVKDLNTNLQKKVEDKTLELRKAHERILEQQKLLQKENKALKNLVEQENKIAEIVGKSPAILSILTMVDKIAPTAATVLIQGESGTGKELIARRLHFKSDRRKQPYVVVNCGALQETLLESELFGHEKGAFTGAVRQKIGLVEMADGGTLFLDEIGEMATSMQSKLLRFLQNGEFYRIGGKRTLRVDVRVISATNRDLEQEVHKGTFREDLFYRLNTITLRMPPLRKRKEDLSLLVDHFLKYSRFGGPHKIKRIDPRVWEVFQKYDWPGNIRELSNTVERLKILAENNEIRLEDIPFSIRMPQNKGDKTDYNVSLTLEELEKNHILRALAYHHGNKTKTARNLGVTIKTLYNKLHRYGVIQQEKSLNELH